MVEYEVGVHGLKMLHGIGVENVTLYIDSQMVARQATREFTTKVLQISKYVELLWLSKQFIWL